MRILLLLALALSPALAAAAPAWSVLPLDARGVDADAAATFRDLLVAELGARNGADFIDGPRACSDLPCARDAGGEVGAGVVVFGRLARLGRNIVVTLTVIDTAAGRTLSQQRMSVDAVEDLEKVASRMAQAIHDGRDLDDTVELGTVTGAEVTPDRRREGKSGLGLRIGGVTPIGDAYRSGFGILVDVGYWYEARDFAIEPRVGWRGTAETDEDESYGQVAIDVGAHYILTRGDFAPFIGVGGGLRWTYEERRERISAGQVIQLESNDLELESAWAPGAFGRVGLLLFRTYSLRMAFTVDYDVTFVDLHGLGAPQAVQAGVSVMF